MSDTADLYHQRMLGHPMADMFIGEERVVPRDDNGESFMATYMGQQLSSFRTTLSVMGRWLGHAYRTKVQDDGSLWIKRVPPRSMDSRTPLARRSLDLPQK